MKSKLISHYLFFWLQKHNKNKMSYWHSRTIEKKNVDTVEKAEVGKDLFAFNVAKLVT